MSPDKGSLRQDVHSKEWMKEEKERLDERVKYDLTSSTEKLKERISGFNLEKAGINEVIELGAAVNNEAGIRMKIGHKKAIKKALSKYIDMGGSIKPIEWAKGSDPRVIRELKKAFSFYPKRWTNYFKEKNVKCLTHKNKRGFFAQGAAVASGDKFDTSYRNYYRGYVTFATDNKNTKTKYHEIGHFIEWANPHTGRLCKEFLKKRIEGEKAVRLKELFPTYSYEYYEITFKDDFISPYRGKKYPFYGTEIFSMGLESIFEPGKGQETRYIPEIKDCERRFITDDEEYMNFIIGLLVTS